MVVLDFYNICWNPRKVEMTHKFVTPAFTPPLGSIHICPIGYSMSPL